MRVAARRMMRVGITQGDILDDLGVMSDVRHPAPRRDVLEGNQDLIDRVIQELAKCKPHRTTISIEPRPSRSPLVIVHAINVSRLEARLDIPAKGGSEQRSFALPTFRGNRAELDPDEISIPTRSRSPQPWSDRPSDQRLRRSQARCAPPRDLGAGMMSGRRLATPYTDRRRVSASPASAAQEPRLVTSPRRSCFPAT